MSTTYIPFTDEQKQRANDADLAEFLRRRGEKLLPSGHDNRLESNHSVTVRGSRWFDHATGEGGHAIDFVQRHYMLSFPEAVSLLLGGENGAAYVPASKESEQRKPFLLPPKSNTMRRVYAYLIRQRGIGQQVITHFARAGLLYEDAEYHNAVFVGNDEHGVARHAHKRSTNSFGDSFRINVEGSDPKYSFHHIGTDERLYVFEAPIDLLSYLTLYPESWQTHSCVSLCGVSEHAMLWMLESNPALTEVVLCLDNDKAGLQADERLTRILCEHGYSNVFIQKSVRKDWNEDLKAQAEPQNDFQMGGIT